MILAAMLSATLGCARQPADHFFSYLRARCGESYTGKTVFPDSPDHPFAGRTLVMEIADCSDSEIRIPFRVGADTSRTWVLKKTAQGLELKHDHRHPDGSPDELTLYSGTAVTPGTSVSQSFPADAATGKMVPEGKTNVWTLTIDPERAIFVYYLERHGKPRYKAIFDMAEAAGH